MSTHVNCLPSNPKCTLGMERVLVTVSIFDPSPTEAEVAVMFRSYCHVIVGAGFPDATHITFPELPFGINVDVCMEAASLKTAGPVDWIEYIPCRCEKKKM